MAAAPRTPPAPGILLVLAAIASVQAGAAVAKTLFDQVPPLAIVWLRLLGAVAVLTLARVVLRGRGHPAPSDDAATRPPRQWRPLLAYAVCLVGMNCAIYEAFHRLNLGVAVTIEFLGPLAVAVAHSRRWRDLVWPVLALAGVAMLGLAPTPLDPVGLLMALLAAACWGGYVITASRVGQSWPALDALTTTCVLGAVALALPAVLAAGPALWHPGVLLAGAFVGVMSTAIPYSLEIVALKTVPQRVFGILMSLEPVAAALAALVLLGERLGPVDLLAMTCVVVASIGVTRSS